MRKIALPVVTVVLFLGAVIGVVAGYSVPAEKEEHVTYLTYEMEGTFDHEAYKKSQPEKDIPNPRYFTNIIDSVEVFYSYWFLPEEPVSRVTEEVAISALVSCPSTWGEMEVELVPRTEIEGDFIIRFPLDTTEFLQLSDNITEELGAAKCSPDIILKATVHTVALTADGVLEDNFVQTARVKLTERTLEWDKDLALTEIGYTEGLKYEHRGNFSYAVKLKPNILFGAITLEPDIPPSGEPVALKPGKPYDSETIDHIEGTFAYAFSGSEELSQAVNEVEITGTVGEVGGWHKAFTLVPESQETGDFSVNFPLYVPFFYAVIESVEEDTGATVSSHELIITANVHTLAQSEFGPVDETFNQNLTVILRPDEVVWPEVEPATKSGTIDETLIVPNPTAGIARRLSLGVLGMMAVALLYTVWRYWESKRRRISRIEADALQVTDKYRNLVVDVKKLPTPVWNGEVTVEIGSLDELIKTADSLLKPILRLAEAERHIYCVIDGVTRYRYVSLSGEPAAPPQPKPPPTDESQFS